MKHVLPAAIAFALLPVLPPASAAPAKKAGPLAAISLALPADHSLRSAGEPLIEVRLTDLSPQAFWLRWTPPYPVVFQVEFKPVLDAGGREAGWTRLTPIPLPPKPAPNPSGTVVVSKPQVVKLKWLPGEQDAFCSLPTGFLLDRPGFYRIRATLTFGKEGDNTISLDPPGGGTSLQPINLALSALPLIISHTAGKYAAVSEIQPRKTP